MLTLIVLVTGRLSPPSPSVNMTWTVRGNVDGESETLLKVRLRSNAWAATLEPPAPKFITNGASPDEPPANVAMRLPAKVT